MHNFRELQVWELAMQIAEEVYRLLIYLPREERYELASQLRGCVVSVPSNIAEGSGRGTDKDFAHFLNMALGSSYELETQLLLAKRLFVEVGSKVDPVLPKLHQLQRMLYSLIKKYRKD
jgi:four helix bundle protein